MMEGLKEDLAEMEIGTSAASFQRFMDTQKDLFHSQVDQLQRIVVIQCKLTGVNPLSQEMAAGALSINIGKRPRDLLNPKAIKYMQAVFSIKDAISKKESREISAQFGITVTQVREFFNSQRSRVRRLVRHAREKGIQANSLKGPESNLQINGTPTGPNSFSLNPVVPDTLPVSSTGPTAVTSSSACQDAVPLQFVGPNSVPLTATNLNPVILTSVGSDYIPLNCITPDSKPLLSTGPANYEGAQSLPKQEEILPGLDDSEKHFIESIFGLLKREETFGGQVKLMERVLQIQNLTLLNWFLTEGGVMILATWLTQAAAEEQTSVLLVALRVLCHLPLHNAFPEHMSAILHSVNTLRFYRTSDISSRARILLAKWTKMFARSRSLRKPNGVGSSIDAQDMILKKSIDEIMSNEFSQTDIRYVNGSLALPSENSEKIRRMESSQTMKLLPASSDDSSRKPILGLSSSHTRERRKVQLVEQPGQKPSSRSPQGGKAASISQGRPMSADDIQKAKMRALYMQSKYGRKSNLSNGSSSVKHDAVDKMPAVSLGSSSQVSKVLVEPKNEELKEPVIAAAPKSTYGDEHQDATTQEVESKVVSKALADSKDEEVKEPVKATPNSIYKDEHQHATKQKVEFKVSIQQLCPRPQTRWNSPREVKLNVLWRVGTGEFSKEVEVQKNRNRREMETVYRTVQEISSNPKEPWDLDMDYDDSLTPEIPIEQQPDDGTDTQMPDNQLENSVAGATTIAQNGETAASTEPDLELLAVLLKNPELVFALTSGQGGNISSDDTVRLLDMMKTGGIALGNSVNESDGKVEVSLPSPTPSSNNPRTSKWKPEVARNPFSQRNSLGIQAAAAGFADATTVTSLVHPDNQITTNMRILPQELPNVHSHQHYHHHHHHHQNFTDHPRIQTSASDLVLPLPNSSPSTSLVERHESRFQQPSSSSTLLQQQQQHQQAYMINESSQLSYLSRPVAGGNVVNVGRVSPTATLNDSWRVRQGVAIGSNSYSSSVNQNAYDGTSTSYGGAQLRSWEKRNERYGEVGCESWSPENSSPNAACRSSRSPCEQIVGSGGYALGGRRASEWPDNRRPTRHRNLHSSSGFQDPPDTNTNRRWR
ncbi:Homeobox protein LUMINIDEPENDENS [Linum perenne]